MAKLIPLDVKYAGNHGELYGIEGMGNIAIFRVPPNSLTPSDINETLKRISNEEGIYNCVLDVGMEGFSKNWRALRATSFTYLAGRYDIRDCYAGLDIRDLNHRTLGIPKGPGGENRVKKIQARFSEKIIGATVDEVVEIIAAREQAGFIL